MILIDTNILLRYALNDHPKLSPKAKGIMLDNEVFIITQVIAETIYVLKGVYKFTREEIIDTLLSIFSMDNVHLEHEEITTIALQEYRDTNFDFVDVLLYSYNKIKKVSVITFDKDLDKKLMVL